MPKLPAKGLAGALAVAIAACTSASAPPPTPRAASGFVVPTELPNGRVEITIATGYALGATATIPVAIQATRGTITGPLAARILASGINESRAPAEALVRELPVTPVTVAAGDRATLTLTWDTRDTKGAVVPADAYSLVFEVRSDAGGTTRMLTAGATLELR